MSPSKLVPLEVLNDRLAICRSDKDEPLPKWAKAPPGEFFSVTRTRDEISIIIANARAPREAKCERDWRLLMVKGPLGFNLVGIIAGLSGTLADAGVSIFAVRHRLHHGKAARSRPGAGGIAPGRLSGEPARASLIRKGRPGRRP
jgi:hypothetical protein